MARKFTQWTGAVFLLLGIVGLFVSQLGNFMHFDGTHNAIHLAFGLWALIAAGNEKSALRYVRAVGVFFIAMSALGIFSPEVFGMMHMELSENIFHFILGAWGLYVGFVQTNLTAFNASEPQ